MRRSPVIFALTSLVVCGLLSWLIASGVVKRVEADARQQTVTALAAAGQNWAGADPAGMRVVLTGEAPDDAAKFKALEVVGQIIDGARIDDFTTTASSVANTLPEFALEILRSGSDVRLIGLVPSLAGEQSVAELVFSVIGAAPNIDLLDEVAKAAPLLWPETMAFAAQLLPIVDQGTLHITAGRVEVTALAQSDAGRAKLEADLMALQPANVTLTLDIKSPLPIVTPFRFAMSLKDGTVTFRECSAETNEGRARILSAVRRAGAAELPQCNLALGSPSPFWPQAVDLAITGLEELGGGTLEVSDTNVTLTALVESDPAKLAQVEADLRAALPQMFSLTTVLPEAASDEVAEYRPLFAASFHPDGSMTLSGAVSDNASRTAIGTYATSLTKYGDVQNSTKIDAKLPEGWSARVLAGIETLTLLGSGTLTISPETLYVEGRGASPDIEQEINDALKARLAQGAAFKTLVVYDPSLSEEIIPPASTECAAEIAEILAKGQISFAPNSGKIAEESLPVIDDIAIVLKNCATASFEIGGHTDSQGGEVLNQALSQTRADAVLDALLERDVLIAHMSARGYGESQPIGDNETDVGRAKNRRIAFKLLEARNEQN